MGETSLPDKTMKKYRVKNFTIKGQIKGELSITEDAIIFDSKHQTLTIPIDKIEDVSISTAKEITAFRVFLAGPLIGTLAKKKRDCITISNKDQNGILRHDVFQTLDSGDIEEIDSKIYIARVALTRNEDSVSPKETKVDEVKPNYTRVTKKKEVKKAHRTGLQYGLIFIGLSLFIFFMIPLSITFFMIVLAVMFLVTCLLVRKRVAIGLGIICIILVVVSLVGTVTYIMPMINGKDNDLENQTQPQTQPQPTTITYVSPITTVNRQTITIIGSGFGSKPQTTDVGDGSVDMPNFKVIDGDGRPNWGGNQWEAGYVGDGDLIGVILVSWNNTVIVLGGFGSYLGQTNHGSHNCFLSVGDVLTFKVNGASHLVTVQSP